MVNHIDLPQESNVRKTKFKFVDSFVMEEAKSLRNYGLYFTICTYRLVAIKVKNNFYTEHVESLFLETTFIRMNVGVSVEYAIITFIYIRIGQRKNEQNEGKKIFASFIRACRIYINMLFAYNLDHGRWPFVVPEVDRNKSKFGTCAKHSFKSMKRANDAKRKYNHTDAWHPKK